MTVYVGTSGWYYPKGKGKWDDLFYPPDLASRDELSYYAERFNAVEINKSFYGPITPSEARSWVERTPPDFRFCAKLYQKFTHPGMFKKTLTRSLPEAEDADDVLDAVRKHSWVGAPS